MPNAFRLVVPSLRDGLANRRPRTVLPLGMIPVLLALVLLAGSSHAQEQGATPPNIVLILVDDLGWADLGCYGNQHHETPHLDRLAREGLRFTDGYAAAAICSPTRAAVMTGRYPARLGITDWIRSRFQGGKMPADKKNPSGWVKNKKRALECPRNPLWMELSEQTIAEVLKSKRYVNAYIGKWHLGMDDWYPDRQGFDLNLGGCDYGQPPSYFDPYANRRLQGIPTLAARKKGEYLTDREGEEAARFISRHKDRPFFLQYAPYAVHTPIQAKKDLIEKYREKNRRTGRKLNARYAAMVESVDDAVGRIMTTLDKEGLTKNTLILFTSDNGGLVGPTHNRPLRSGKGYSYEGGLRVPFIARWPGVIPAATTSAEPVCSIDILPTLAEAAGVALAKDRTLDGLSLLSHLKSGGKKTLGRSALFWHFPHYRHRDVVPYSVVRAGSMKLIHRHEPDRAPELFDLAADPGEKTDLAAKKPKVVAALQDRLENWLEEVGARVPRKKAKKVSSRFRFAVVGDTQGLRLFDRIVTRLNEEEASCLVIPGDLVDTGATEAGRAGSWRAWTKIAQRFKPGASRIIMTPGNHDLPSGGDERWRKTFEKTPDGKPWLPMSQEVQGLRGLDQMDYYVDFGSLRFVSITTDTKQYGAGVLGEKTLKWLFAVMEESEKSAAVEHVFVLTHHPVTFDSGNRTIEGTSGTWWQGMTERSAKLRALFTGHWHLYQPSRPDPRHPKTWEVVGGTGGGGLEGRQAQNHHGFLIVDVLESGAIKARFFSDEDGKEGGWKLEDELDAFTLYDPTPRPIDKAPLAQYSFEFGPVLRDSGSHARSKAVSGRLKGGARSGPGSRGKALVLSRGGHAEAAAIGDYELAVLGDLTLDLHFRLDGLQGEEGATLVEYSSGGKHPHAESEAVNTSYSLRLSREGRLSLAWEHGRGKDVEVLATRLIPQDAGVWKHLRCHRDAARRKVAFFVNGKRVGDELSFEHLPTGGAAGFLHIGRAANGKTGFWGAIDELSIFGRVLEPGETVPKAKTPGDFSGNGAIGNEDFAGFGKAFSKKDPRADINGDRRVDFDDVEIFLAGVGMPRPDGRKSDFSLTTSLAAPIFHDLGGEYSDRSYRFEDNRGLVLYEQTETTRLGYHLEFKVAFTSFGNGKWGKLVDFADRSSDIGLYLRTRGEETCLEFFKDLGVGKTPLVPGVFHRVEVLRDDRSNRLTVFLDGKEEFSFVDAKGLTVFKKFHLFCDDRGNESAAGYVFDVRFSGSSTRPPLPPEGDRLHLPMLRLDADGGMHLLNRSPDSLKVSAIMLRTAGQGRVTLPEALRKSCRIVERESELRACIAPEARPIVLKPGAEMNLGKRENIKAAPPRVEVIDAQTQRRYWIPILEARN